MSALEQMPLPTRSERRLGDRIRLDRMLPALVGRSGGTFVDLSMRGAKIRHEAALRRGAALRVVFSWESEQFSAAAEVLASRVVALGPREGESTLYESRFRFVQMAQASRDLLERVLVALSNDTLRNWVGNLYASGETIRLATTPTSGFLRCRHIGMRWEQRWTRDTTQPADGFVLPSVTEPSEIRALCKAWEAMDHDARHLLRLTASAVCEGALPVD